jgi:hypothetical protein
MARNTPNSRNLHKATRSTKLLVALGMPAILFTVILAGRIVWEETFLTIQQGPQMIGFSLAHGVGGILFFAPLALSIWLVVALLIMAGCLWRKISLSNWYWSTLASAILALGFLSIPPAFWQWAFIENFAKSTHAADLMVNEAMRGDVRTVRGYLDHGVPLTATNYEGVTAAYAAAVGGRLPMLEMLASRGANLDATNLYGDSPLEAAIHNGHASVANFLKAHGASKIQGTSEQRSAASQAIVLKQMERERLR